MKSKILDLFFCLVWCAVLFLLIVFSLKKYKEENPTPPKSWREDTFEEQTY